MQQNPLVLPVWQTCPQVNKTRNKSKSAAQVGLREPNKGQWVCADCCISGNNVWTRDGPSKCLFWLLPKKVQKAVKLGQGSQRWSFSVRLQMIWSLSQERASCSKPCPDHTFISSLALLFQLRTTEEVQGTPEQEGGTLSNYPSSCTAKGVCAQHEARPSAQGWGPGEGSSVAPGGVPWGITHGTGQTVVELFTLQPTPSTLVGVRLQLPSSGNILWGSICLLLTSKGNLQSWLTMGSLGRVLWNMPPVDVAPPKFKRYKSKFWKCIILYDKVWQRNAVFSFIVSYILFLWELMRMFSYLTCVLPSL